jgi:peptidyl-dipeptidase A
VALPFLCGTLVHWEREFYADELPAARLGARWWQLARTYQGIAPPPAAGTTDWCPAACPPLATAPGHGYDAAFGAVLAHELHARICREILDQDPLTADYRSQPDPFAPLDAVVARGAELTWPQLVQAAAGGTLSAAALVDYYAPLLAWLEEQNRDRRTAFR